MKNRSVLIKSLAVVAAVAGLVACGGGSRSAAPFFSGSTTVSTSASNFAALSGQTFTFPSGVSAFGTTGVTDVAFAGSGASPTFTIGSAGMTASGTMSYGSCIFTVTFSTYPATSPLALGNKVTVNPCTYTLNANGASRQQGPEVIPVVVTLGTAPSNPVSVIANVSSTGAVSVGGNETATLTPATGG